MEFRVMEVVSKGVEHSFNEELDMQELLGDRKDVLSASPLRASLAVRPFDGTAQVSGELSADLTMACSRCLEPTEEHIVIPIEERFAHVSAVKDINEDEDLIIVSEDKVDLKPYVEGTMLLYLPMSPLCSDDCKGLCPDCGINLNEQSCGCSQDKIDPRFEALKKLLE
ncbi:YceD family protein [Paenibacillus sp. D51F]